MAARGGLYFGQGGCDSEWRRRWQGMVDVMAKGEEKGCWILQRVEGEVLLPLMEAKSKLHPILHEIKFKIPYQSQIPPTKKVDLKSKSKDNPSKIPPRKPYKRAAVSNKESIESEGGFGSSKERIKERGTVPSCCPACAGKREGRCLDLCLPPGSGRRREEGGWHEVAEVEGEEEPGRRWCCWSDLVEGGESRPAMEEMEVVAGSAGGAGREKTGKKEQEAEALEVVARGEVAGG